MGRALLLSLVLVLCSLANAEAGEFDDCMKLFSASDFANASVRFEKLIAREPTPRNLYYCALAQARNKNESRAVQLLSFLVEKHPNSREAYFASRTLNDRNEKLKAGSAALAAGSQNKAKGFLPAGSAVTVQTKAQKEQPKNANFASRDMTGLIVVVKSHDERPEPSPSFVYDVSNQLKNIPLPLVHLLRQNNLKLYLSTTAVDYNPQMESIKPRGYENGKSFRDVPAFYEPNTRHLVVAEYAFGSGSLVKTDDPLGAMWHELGHAVDHVMGNLSHDKEYLRIYYNCKRNVDDGTAAQIAYYLQPGDGGPSETFAELFAINYGSRNNAWRQSQAERVSETFGELSKFIRRKVADLR